MGLLKRALERLIRLCTGIETFLLPVYKWGLASALLCECGALDQCLSTFFEIVHTFNFYLKACTPRSSQHNTLKLHQ